ncbi:ATP-binding protein [Terriglobus roseus]|uniref:histidine kinase n=1 Tax=Terriglobus roseus TaxID=392734 RepID=A0A1H4RNS1_9BACT|nr:ATP-binding protein [Terriglobus roseus]SEC33487.1 Cyclic nucleotide-binding domain-containing protein [Terriglobus roseus]
MATFADCLVNSVEWQRAAIAELQRLQVFGPDAPESELACLVAVAQEQHTAAGVVLVDEVDNLNEFHILLEGKVRVSRKDAKGNFYFNKVVEAPEFMGEVPLLSGMPAQINLVTVTEVRGLRLDADAFWHGMAECPHLRAVVLSEMRLRMRGLQQQQSQQEKLAMLGTMTAGLMHELNNPGAAARRAASQLRSNLQRMHALARSFSERGHTPDQRACLTGLQERALSVRSESCMSSIQQSDAEEEMGVWMDERGISKAWEFAPVLVASGIEPGDLNCLANVFSPGELSEPIEWLEATASSMQMVSLVEDSVARVTELAQAVKTYAHEGQAGIQDVDLNESIHTTVVMMKHKLREKNIRMQKDFGPNMPKLHCMCSGLNQVWTNLLDNAIDAVPSEGGMIAVHTARVGDELEVSITDNGAGISPEAQEHIFDPFFTTKAAGVGSGMGLGIVRQILESYHGRLELESKPGRTQFTVRIPADQNF